MHQFLGQNHILSFYWKR